MSLKSFAKIRENEKGDLSSGIGLLLLLVIIGLALALVGGKIYESQSWVQAIGPLITSFLKVVSGILLVALIIAGAYYLHLAIAYYFCFLFKEKNGVLYVYIGKELKKILAYKILENKIVVMYSNNKKHFKRRSFYRANRALKEMENLLIKEYKIPELIVNEEKLNKMIQKWNFDDEIKYLAKQELSKHSSTRRLSRSFRKTEPLIDLKSTYP